MATPNDRIVEILEEGVEGLWASDDLTDQEYAEVKDFVELVKANVDDMRPKEEY